MASDATAHAPLAPPSVCASPSRQQMDGASLQRPFTASGARRTRLLAVQVHWGEHLDRLSRYSIDDALEENMPSTYVALRANQDAAHGSDAKTHVLRAQHDEDSVQGEWYDLHSSPFATSRVVERNAHPTWNELLLVSLPIGWRQQADAATWRLHVDVVGRDPSQQEDSLLATVELSLALLATHRTPQHLQLELQPLQKQVSSSSETGRCPRIYLSLSESDNLEAPQEVAEVTVQELLHAAQLARTDAACSEALLLVFSPLLPPPKELREFFHDPHAESWLDTTTSVWVSPMSRPKATERDERRSQWQFPMMFCLPQAAPQESGAYDSLSVHLFTVSHDGRNEVAPSFTRVASSNVALLHIPLNGASTILKVVLQMSGTDPSADQLQLIMTVRRWDADAWIRFRNTSVNRRVITTNRRHRKRAELQALGWTGALCRGLNRYPISSFCDEGGISSLLASYLAANNTAGVDAVGQMSGLGTDLTADGERDDARLPEALLNQHIRLLQQEIMVKQENIQKIQRELDAQKLALHHCGRELVAARKEVRARDELLAQLHAKIREQDEREAGQTRELLAGSSGLTGLRLDSQGAQRMNMLIFKYKELEQRHEAVAIELANSKRTAGAFEQLERKYADLEQAHIVQAALVQRLQKDRTRNADLQKTLRMQEKVIRKFENAVQLQCQHQQGHSPPRAAPAAADILKAILPSGSDTAQPDTSLQAMRVQVLERQLQVNAKSAASEIGRLKMRVLELEAQLIHQGEASNGQSNPQLTR